MIGTHLCVQITSIDEYKYALLYTFCDLYYTCSFKHLPSMNLVIFLQLFGRWVKVYGLGTGMC